MQFGRIHVLPLAPVQQIVLVGLGQSPRTADVPENWFTGRREDPDSPFPDSHGGEVSKRGSVAPVSRTLSPGAVGGASHRRGS